MSVFSYEARTEEGVKQLGTVEAGSREAAIETLQRHNLIITRLEDLSSRAVLQREVTLPFLQQVSKKDLVMFSKQLSVLFGARVPLIESLRTIAEQTSSKSFRVKLAEVASDVDGGMAFSQALAKHPDVFSLFYVNIVKSGEVSGRLQEVLEYLAKSIEREYTIARKIRGAMIYPAVVFMVFSVVVALMVLFIIPQLRSVLEETGQELPLVTRIILGSADALRQFFLVIVGLLLAGIIAFVAWVRSKQGKETWDTLLLRFPIVGGLATNLSVARMADNLGTLVAAGVTITRALEVTGDVVGNEAFKRIITESNAAVRSGEQIHAVMRQYPNVIPIMVSHMVAIGEKTGKLESILEHIARFYQAEVDETIDNLVSLIEPLLISVLGIMVAILVAGILLPIYNLAGSL